MKPESTISRHQWQLFALCWGIGACAGMNSTLFSVMLPQAVQAIVQLDDRNIISQMGATIMSLFLIGWMLGGIVCGILSDHFGRVRVLAASVVCYSLFTGLASLTTSAIGLTLCRFLTGIGVGGAMVSISVILAEGWPGRSKAVAVGCLITSYQLGVFIAGAVCQVCPAWRAAFAMGGVPIVLAIFALLTLRESERSKTSADTTTQSTSVDYRNVIVGSIIFGSLLVGYWASVSWVPTWIQDLAGADPAGSSRSTATLYHGLAAMSGCLVAGYLADSWGRLKTILLAFVGAWTTSFWMFVSNETFSSIIYGQYALLGFFVGLAQAILYIYLPELFPTKIRATCVGLCLNCGRLVTALTVQCMGVLVPFMGGYSGALIAFSCCYLIGAAMLLKAQETGLRQVSTE